MLRLVARFAGVGILNSRPDGSREVLVSVSDSFFVLFFFVGNLPEGIFVVGIFLVTVFIILAG